MKGRTWNFDYRYTVEPSGPGLMIATMDQSVEKTCPDCGAQFLGSRIAKRCPTCRKPAQKRQEARGIVRRRERKLKGANA